MPEGDTVARHADRLRPVLEGERIVAVEGTAPSIRRGSNRILDATVSGIRTVGKNLLIDLSTGYSIRVHLGMPGRWQISPTPEGHHGSARVVLVTSRGQATCYAAPTVELDRTKRVEAGLEGIGPDLLGDFDEEEFVRRARTRDDRSMAEMLLDQQVLAGIGNVYKSELLFLEGVHPETLVRQVDDERLRSMARRAGKLLAANVRSGPRSTTGSRVRGRETWVYGREGRPCRRCGHAIEMAKEGGRVTYWCPVCQPQPADSPGV
ncbi:MAG: DNA-formamidopyrimidine glycosylase family protein [Acidimicrobiia bacterium]|jgi:endonuclease-8